VEILGGDRPEILAATAYSLTTGHEIARSGQLLSLTPRGALQRVFSFDDRLAFRAGEYGAPWGVTDYRVDESAGTRRVAIAAHHYTWWPGMVTVLDEEWRRLGTFVNAGWIERVHWLSRDRLLIAGFSEARDGGMIAALDVNALSGQSPVETGSQFYCAGCGDARPLRYVVMPRSELNRVTASRFNRALLQVSSDLLTVRTIEVPSSVEGQPADAIYEFSLSLGLVRASFSARYWDIHRALEIEGTLDHPRDQCPDRDGPRAIQIWEPPSGWTTLTIH